jgi:precorrin-3B synthase
MTIIHVRGACPSLPAPMETGDGLLVRLLPISPLRIDAFIGLCQAARAHGNGTIEVSARGSLQVRGLTPASAPLFADAIAGLDIDISDGVPVLADPLPGDPAALIDAIGLAAELRKAIAEVRLTLAPKVSIVVDGGGHIDLDALGADIRVRAFAPSDGLRLELAIAGDAKTARPVATISTVEAVAEVLALLKAIAAHGPEARAADLPQTIVRRKSGPAASRKCARADAVGRHPLRNNTSALGLGLAFGHADAGDLIELTRMAKGNGALWLRPSPGRALLLGPLSEAGADTAREAAKRLGFVTETTDPRRRVAACPGAPFCAHGLIAARALAAEIAHLVPPDGNGIALHVSGCAKGCAYPKEAPLTVVGTEQGCGITRNGTAQDKPTAYVDPACLIAALHGIVGEAREVMHA